jgi:pimeloyl-ACP methyl ester carboxylesterase
LDNIKDCYDKYYKLLKSNSLGKESMKKIKSFDGTNISYEINRKSKLFLILLHGLGGNLRAWDEEKTFFNKKSISTIAIDLRGHGLSDRPRSIHYYKLENFARDIYEIIKKEKIADFILVGHCFGGMVVMDFHRLFPDLAKSYVFIDTNYKSPRKLKQLLEKNRIAIDLFNLYLKFHGLKTEKHRFSFKEFTNSSDLDLSRFLTDVWRTSLVSWILTFENISKFDETKTLKTINKPVLIIEGKNDSIFNISIAKRINKLIKNSELKLIPFENHIIILNNPNVLEEEIYSFIGKLNKRN